jgi:hypothetical protein
MYIPHILHTLGQPDDRVASLTEELFRWLRVESKIPNYVLPDGPRNLFPESRRELRLVSEPTNQGNGQLYMVWYDINALPEWPFQLSHCATTFHKLTFRVETAASDKWFISPAPAAQSVSQYLETTLGIQKSRPCLLTIPDLSKCPFDVYMHTQSPGDLLIVPPLWCVYSRRFHTGGG